jgi:signal peptidase
MKKNYSDLIKRIITIVVGALTAIIFITSITIFILGLIAQENNNTLRIFGYSYAIVATGSMEPVIKPGDFILYDDSSIDEVQIDDIIIFYSKINDKTICHRVIGYLYNSNNEIELITQGDANSVPDSDIISSSEGNFMGIVVKIMPLMGIGNSILNYKSMIFVIIGFIFAVLIVKEVLTIKKQIIISRAEKEKADFIEQTKKEIMVELLNEMKEKNKKE